MIERKVQSSSQYHRDSCGSAVTGPDSPTSTAPNFPQLTPSWPYSRSFSWRVSAFLSLLLKNFCRHSSSNALSTLRRNLISDKYWVQISRAWSVLLHHWHILTDRLGGGRGFLSLSAVSTTWRVSIYITWTGRRNATTARRLGNASKHNLQPCVSSIME